MRLDRFLSGQTAFSRKELTAFIRSGAVTIDGAVIRKPDTQIDPEQAEVTLCGKQITYAAHHYYLLHKPAGVITASRDPKQKTVLDLLEPEDRIQGLFPSGRLDIDTEGLLLITNDGALSHQMLSPKHHVAKYYLARLAKPFQQEYTELFRGGILLREGDGEELCQPAECRPVSERLAVLELHEGKYHQVKRMFAAVGNHVENLLRVGIGTLRLPPDLAPGSYFRIFNKDVYSALKNSDISEVCAFCAEYYSSYWINEWK